MTPRLYVLPLATFAAATEAFVYVGLLSELTNDLGVSLAAGGSLAAAFTLVYALSVPFLASLTAHWDRTRVLILGLGGVAIINAAAAYAPNFETLLATRIAAGFAAALIGPSASTAASHMVPPERRGRAIAVVLAGTTLAFSLGVPIGSAIGGIFGWRSTFLFAAAIAAFAAVMIALVLPKTGETERAGLSSLKLAFRPDIMAVLLQTTAAFGATFASISLIGPLSEQIAGLSGGEIGLVQACIGIGSILGIVVGGALADTSDARRHLLWLFAVIGVTQLGFTLLMRQASVPDISYAPFLAASVLFGASALFAIGPIQQTRLIGAEPDQRMVVLALHGTSIFLGQSAGAAMGAATTGMAGLAWTGAAGFVAAALAMTLLLAGKMTPSRGRTAFRSNVESDR